MDPTKTNPLLLEAVQIQPILGGILEDIKKRETDFGYDRESAYIELKGKIAPYVGSAAENPKLSDRKYYEATVKAIDQLLPPDDKQQDNLWGDLIRIIRQPYHPDKPQRLLKVLRRLNYTLIYSRSELKITRGKEHYSIALSDNNEYGSHDDNDALYNLARNILLTKLDYQGLPKTDGELDDYLYSYE